MNLRNKTSGFTLVEVITASILSCITLTCIVQFFLTQLRQYKQISNYNQLNENLRITSKFLEKDVHNSLEFYIFYNLQEALKFDFNAKGTLNSNTSGECLLLVQERGTIDGGRGIIYYLGKKTSTQKEEENEKIEQGSGSMVGGSSTYHRSLYRAMVSFKGSKIEQTEDKLSKLKLADLRFIYVPTGIISSTFYIVQRRKFNGTNILVPGCRHGLCAKFTMIAGKGGKTSLDTNFCFFSRNPRFYLPE